MTSRRVHAAKQRAEVSGGKGAIEHNLQKFSPEILS